MSFVTLALRSFSDRFSIDHTDIGIPSRGPRLKTNERKYKRNGDENDGGSGGGGGGEGEEGVRQREGEIDRAAEG